MKAQSVLLQGVFVGGALAAVLVCGCGGGEADTSSGGEESAAALTGGTIDPYNDPMNWEVKVGCGQKIWQPFNREYWYEQACTGYIQHTYYIPSAGTYELYVAAEGTYAGGAWPNLTVSADGGAAWATHVINQPWNGSWLVPTYSSGYLTAGYHAIRIGFPNDYAAPGQDRNLFIRGGISFWNQNTGVGVP
jgi:hypothetical protein